MFDSRSNASVASEGVYQKSEYRRDIDGLRAIAVIAVIVNHLRHQWLPGGYLGVDVFFVISGYVITSSLQRERNSSLTSQLLHFYSRRIKRLMPALMTMTIGAAALIRLVDLDPQISILTGICSIFGISNIFLFLQSTNYFGIAIQRNIFAHTWSLGAEEQFYLMYPFLIRWGHPAKNSNSIWDDRFRLGVLASLSAVSFGLFVSTYRIHQPAAYFLMPYRFWELGAGCTLALFTQICRNRGVDRPLEINPLLPLAILVPCLVMAGEYPVSCTFAAVLATTALIGSMAARGPVYQFLSHPATVYVGAISYSLYLWHWPVICLSYWTIGIRPWTLPFQIALMLLLAAGSYHLIENRLRRRNWTSSRWGVLALGLPAMVLSGALVFAGQQFGIPRFSGDRKLEAGTDVPAPGYVAKFSARKLDSCFARRVFDSANSEEIRKNVEYCTARAASPLRLVFVGDSTATDLFPFSDELYKSGVATVVNVTQPGCKFPAVDVPEDKICDYPDRLLQQITRQQAPETVFVVRNNYAPRRVNGDLTRFSRLLEQELDRLSATGVKVIYFAPSPKYYTVGDLCSPQWFRPEWAMGPECKNGFLEDRSEELARRQDVVDYLEGLAQRRKDFLVFDPFSVLCGNLDAAHCTPVRDGRVIYRDGTHLTATGSELMVPAFVEFLRNQDLLAAGRADLQASR